MPAIADIKLSSIIGGTVRSTSATVGVDTTYGPNGFKVPGVAEWCDRSSGISIGYPRLSLSVRPPTKASRVYRVQAKLVLPTLNITSPSTGSGIQPLPSVGYSCQAIMDFLLPEASTAAERAKLLSHCASLFFSTINASDDVPTDSSGSPLLAAINNFDQPY